MYKKRCRTGVPGVMFFSEVSMLLSGLQVLETCVKNCGHRFHSLIAKKDFLDELTKIINPKVTI